MAVTSRTELIQYALRELGAPLIEINVAEEQIQDRVDEALEFFREYHWDGIEKTYLPIQLTQQIIDEKKIILDDSMIYGVIKIHYIGSNLSSNNLFSLEYQLRVQDLYNLIDADLINYAMTHQHLSLLNDQLIGHRPFRFNRLTNTVHLDTNMAKFDVDDYILVECYKIIDEESVPAVWNNAWLKLYTAALIKRQWGSNLKKFSGMQLPGGVTIDGAGLYQEADSEVNELKTELQDKSAPLEFFVG